MVNKDIIIKLFCCFILLLFGIITIVITTLFRNELMASDNNIVLFLIFGVLSIIMILVSLIIILSNIILLFINCKMKLKSKSKITLYESEGAVYMN